MLRIFLLLAAIAVGYCTQAQDPKIYWGDEYKVGRGVGLGMKVLCADSSGIYLVEQGYAPMVLGAPVIMAGRLLKLDKDLHHGYEKTYSRDFLKDKQVESFFAFRDKLLIVASTYHRKERSLEIFAAEINKSTGELMDSMKSIASIQKEIKGQEIGFKVLPNADTSGFIIFSALANRERYRFQVMEFNKDLAAISQPVTISNEFKADVYRLEDVLFTADRKIVMVGKVLQFPEGRRKADLIPEIGNYHIRIYDEQGRQINEVNTNINGRWLINAKVLLTKNKELVLAGFYSNSKKIVANGLLVLRIDPSTGEVKGAAEKEINYSVLTVEKDNDDKDDDKDERKGDEAFSKNMTFRNIFHTADGGLVLLAENYKDDIDKITPGVNYGAYHADLKNTYFDSDEIMMCKIDAGNNISWVHVLPKMQRERMAKIIPDWSIIKLSAFFYQLQAPYHSGFGAMQNNGKIELFFNDNPKNANVLQPGQRVYIAKKMSQTHCFRVTLDEVTGKYERKYFFDNEILTAPMLRHADVIGSEMYIIGKTPASRIGKNKLSVARIYFE
jgi:hypothetical protein